MKIAPEIVTRNEIQFQESSSKGKKRMDSQVLESEKTNKIHGSINLPIKTNTPWFRLQLDGGTFAKKIGLGE